MSSCMVATFYEQGEVVDVVYYYEVIMRLVLTKANANILPLTTRKFVSDVVLLLLVGSCLLAYLTFPDVLLAIFYYSWPIYTFSCSE